MEVFFKFFLLLYFKKIISKDILSKEKCLENPLLNNLVKLLKIGILKKKIILYVKIIKEYLNLKKI